MKLDPTKMKDWQVAEAAEANLKPAAELLADLMDPVHAFPKSFDNDRFGRSSAWPDVLGCREANNCRHCGKCAALMGEVFK